MHIEDFVFVLSTKTWFVGLKERMVPFVVFVKVCSLLEYSTSFYDCCCSSCCLS